MTTFLAFETHDVRFPTSRMLDGSDAMNPDPDYSAAALILRGRYLAPTAPGASAELRPESVKEFSYPMGPTWPGSS